MILASRYSLILIVSNYTVLFEYSAVNKDGNKTKGEESAEGERELALKLRSQNLLLVESWEKGRQKNAWRFNVPGSFSIFGRVSLVEKINFSRNLAVMVGAGLSLTKSLNAMANQTTNSQFKKVISDIIENVTKGKSFADSLTPHKKIFGDIFINMIAAGEISGRLEKTLILLAKQMKRDYDLRSRVRGAMIYPAVVLSVLVIIAILMLTYVVPTLTDVFSELGTELPVTTRMLISSSDFLMHHYLILLVAFIGTVVSFMKLVKTARGKEIFDTIIVRMPIFGPLILKFNLARFSRTFSSLISSGVTITKSLDITSSVIGNVLYRRSIAQASEEIQKGRPINGTLKRHPRLYPPMFTQTIEVGEETGTIARMLLRLAIFYEDEVTTATKNLSTLIEPLLMIFIGGAVGFFAISIIQPIYGGLGGL